MEECHVQVTDGSLRYTDVGSGRPVVFVQGVWVSKDLWNDIVETLTSGPRCIRVDWPLGGHREPFPPAADLSPNAIADMVLDLIERLDLEDVVLVGNDTGGAVCQLAIAADRPAVKRITGLLLTNADSFENFPPKAFKPVQWLARFAPPLANMLIARIAGGPGGAQRFMDSVCAKPVPADKAISLLSNFSASREVRADSLRFLAGANAKETTLRAAERFQDFKPPVVVVWGDADQLFPLSDGQRLAAAFPNARLVPIPGAKTFTPLDATETLARALDELVGGRRPA